ncbi:VOC family protein [Ascidiimonas sp. W6]|uniref:VOC family protein n=1 Tax=Ascidiimonas meishanensis TaxID=3128903 RepID=UPI0030EB22F0
MPTLIPYIVFSGNCRKALDFYCNVFNGTIQSIETFDDSPIPVDAENAKRIFDSEFFANGIHFKASDDLPEHKVTKGTNISMFVAFDDMLFRKEAFEKLAEHGKVLFELNENFGMVKDPFGIQWMFTINT